MSDIEKHASEAGVDRLLRHTAGIVNGVRVVGTIPATGKTGDEEQPGTGCFIRWGNHLIILTARHVIENAQIQDLRVFAYPSDGFKVKPTVEVTKEDIVEAVRLDGRSAAIYSCAWEDLAVLTIDPDDFPGAEFVDIAKDRTDVLEGELVSCCGFPSDCHVTASKSAIKDREIVDIGLIPIVFSGNVLPAPTESDMKFKFTEFNPANHYLVPYMASTMTQHPRGISGAAMWRESDEKLVVWRPNFKFAGTCVCSYKDGTVVQVVKASVVALFLEEIFGSPDRC
jgi:hypothetical protein